ncbi:MAG: SDR family NAD(P)-dependent oxidoreductase [Agriterribacter sp.]
MAIENKVIVITGGASGIGLALAKHFILNNTVVSIDRNPKKIELLKIEVPKVISLKADICNKTEIEKGVAEIKSSFSKIDMLVHSAGIGRFYNFDAMPEDELLSLAETEIATDFVAPILITKKCLPLLKQSPDPKIVYITTGLAYMPDTASPTYCSSKVGLHFFAMSLRHQLKDTNIKVIEVLPAAVDTEFSKGIDVPKISTEKFVKSFVGKLEKGKTTIRIGMANVLYMLSRFFPSLAFKIINGKK